MACRWANSWHCATRFRLPSAGRLISWPRAASAIRLSARAFSGRSRRYMDRDPRAYLWDARDSADAIAEFVTGRTLNDYLADRMLRSAVERQFEIVGEALRQLEKTAEFGPPDSGPCACHRVPQHSDPWLHHHRRSNSMAHDRGKSSWIAQESERFARSNRGRGPCSRRAERVTSSSR